ncbi:MAG: hypothetical protein M0R46_16485 [Candidatus Muirbacterium halophilum]|nr:hypothetical protein [Candidatus Muirbacterium halophilum]
MIDYFENLGRENTIVFCTDDEHHILLPVLDDLGYRWSDYNERILGPKYLYSTYYSIDHSSKTICMLSTATGFTSHDRDAFHRKTISVTQYLEKVAPERIPPIIMIKPIYNYVYNTINEKTNFLILKTSDNKYKFVKRSIKEHGKPIIREFCKRKLFKCEFKNFTSLCDYIYDIYASKKLSGDFYQEILSLDESLKNEDIDSLDKLKPIKENTLLYIYSYSTSNKKTILTIQKTSSDMYVMNIKITKKVKYLFKKGYKNKTILNTSTQFVNLKNLCTNVYNNIQNRTLIDDKTIDADFFSHILNLETGKGLKYKY